VKLESFFLGRTTITQAQWREVAGWVEGPGERWGLDLSGGLAPSSFQGTQRPVENVNWYEAMEFCSRLSQRSGKTYTLPSEAQWEYACRASTTSPFHYGDTLSAEVATYHAEVTYGRGPKGKGLGVTTEVGRFPANDWGLHDMHGTMCGNGAPITGTAATTWASGKLRTMAAPGWMPQKRTRKG
jgi:formylglycine-generating enzyme required for sulfatase activity